MSPPATLSQPATTPQVATTVPSYCNICSRHDRHLVHGHNSPREIRIMQGVEYETSNLSYMCPTCRTSHSVRPETGMNIVVSTSQLHNIHTPRSESLRCESDPVHIDWLTVTSATIRDLELAWLEDYHSQPRAMRILLSAGIDDFVRGRSRNQVVESFMHFKNAVDKQNSHHPEAANELVIATLLNPPKLCWFSDNGPLPPNHPNLLGDIKELNAWICNFNKENGKVITPRFHRFGVKDGWELGPNGSKSRVKRHIMSQWLQSERRAEKLHLSHTVCIKLGRAVVRHFQGEIERFGILG